MTNQTSLRWILRVSGKKKIYMLFLSLIQIALGISGVAFAVMLSKLVDGAVGRDRSGFLLAAAGLILIMLGQLALRAANRFLEESAKSSLENGFKKRLYENLFTRDYGSVTATHSGEWMNRLTSDTVIVADGMAQIVPGVSGMAVKMLGALIAILYYLPVFGYVLVPGGILLVLLTYAFRKRLKALHRKVQEADGDLRVFLQESIESMMIVRAYAREERMAEDVTEKMNAHRNIRLERMRFSNVCNVGFGSAMHGAYVLGAIVCGFGILNGTMSYGNLMAVLQLIGQIQAPFANITGYIPKFYAMLASAERLMEIEAFSDSGEQIEEKKSLEKIQEFYHTRFEAICMENVGFTYRPKPGAGERPIVLHHLNLKIKKGDYIALVGSSGCGKSTVLKLLMSLYPLDEGEQYLRTSEGKKQPLTAADRKLFAYVPQGNALMSGSIREVVTFADRQQRQEEERIWQALGIACAEEFVRELPQGIDTVLGEHGIGLSEGQMQRIAVARAICSGNPILLLDEATSALDEDTEVRLLTNLRRLTDKTVVIVTHRPAALEICDTVVKLEAGV